MTANHVTCKKDDTMKDVINIMEYNQIRRIIVVDDKNNVIGILAQADIAVRSGESAGK